MEVEKVLNSLLLLVAVETVVQGLEGTVGLLEVDRDLPAKVWCLRLVVVILAVRNPPKRLLVGQQALAVSKQECLHHTVVQQAAFLSAHQ